MRVAALYVYPVKSCAGISLDETRVGPAGLQHDRRFALLGPHDRPLTQRELPLLASITPRLDADTVYLDLGGLAEVRFSTNSSDGALNDYLGLEVRLAKSESEPFFDAAPLLVVNAASLRHRPMGLQRFRANIVVEGAEALAERLWRSIEADEVRLECDAACERCQIIGEEALRSYPTFGVYCRVAQGGRLRVGEALRA